MTLVAFSYCNNEIFPLPLGASYFFTPSWPTSCVLILFYFDLYFSKSFRRKQSGVEIFSAESASSLNRWQPPLDFCLVVVIFLILLCFTVVVVVSEKHNGCVNISKLKTSTTLSRLLTLLL